ncbi:hypothetical protein C7M84_017421 [Penaeus vannamei]|uniref:Uncharacterized protein n=1 Tax=Penaeus vannamei TaxID=6689 RepID=A0A3R7SKD9_PENVA|nr:hypothetical protein C7M84_017421 [Penaeus vannamei]
MPDRSHSSFPILGNVPPAALSPNYFHRSYPPSPLSPPFGFIPFPHHHASHLARSNVGAVIVLPITITQFHHRACLSLLLPFPSPFRFGPSSPVGPPLEWSSLHSPTLSISSPPLLPPHYLPMPSSPLPSSLFPILHYILWCGSPPSPAQHSSRRYPRGRRVARSACPPPSLNPAPHPTPSLSYPYLHFSPSPCPNVRPHLSSPSPPLSLLPTYSLPTSSANLASLIAALRPCASLAPPGCSLSIPPPRAVTHTLAALVPRPQGINLPLLAHARFSSWAPPLAPRAPHPPYRPPSPFLLPGFHARFPLHRIQLLGRPHGVVRPDSLSTTQLVAPFLRPKRSVEGVINVSEGRGRRRPTRVPESPKSLENLSPPAQASPPPLPPLVPSSSQSSSPSPFIALLPPFPQTPSNTILLTFSPSFPYNPLDVL